jgi:iron complex outermembrane recepter protein
VKCRLLVGVAFLANSGAGLAESQPAEQKSPIAVPAGTPASAQSTDSAEQPEEDEIIVTSMRSVLPATALPLTVDVLGGEDLREQIAVSGSVVDAISARLPAFSPTREKLSGAGETLRGRSPLFAIDGVPQSTPIRDGARDGYTIDPFFIDRVEVIYGSNALQGIGATGGVVNQVTARPPSHDGWSGRILNQVTANSRIDADALGGKTAALASYRFGAFDMTGGAALERRGVFVDGDGRRIGVDGTQGEVQDSDSWSLFGRVGYQVSPSARLDVVANRFSLEGNEHYVVVAGDRATGRPTSSESGRTPGEPTSNKAQLLSASFSDSALGGGNFVTQLFFSRTRDIFGGGIFASFQDPALAPVGQLFDQSVNQSRKLGGKLSYQRAVPGLDALIVTAGIDALLDGTEQTLAQTGRQWVPQTDFRSVAPFLQGNLRLFDGLVRLAGGVRRENVTLDVPDFTTLASYGSRRVAGGSPKFRRTLVNGGIVVEPLRGLRGYASYTEGYTIPDVGRILRGITQVGVDVDTFLDMKPIVSNNREIGLEWKRGTLTASASYYWSDSDFGSLLVRNADGIYDLRRQPISIEGLDVSVDWRTPLPGLTLGGALARVRGMTDNNNDGEFETDLNGANIAPNRLNLYAELSRGTLDARLAMRTYFERSFDGEDPRNAFEGYTLFDAFVGYSLGRQRLTLGVQNLTDRQYITYYSDTQGPADNLLYFAGRGRTFTLGLTSRF